MQKIAIGRSLDENKNPIEGTGILVEVNSPTMKLFRANKSSLLYTNPISGEVGMAIHVKDKEGNLVERGLGIMPAGAVGPPEHIHPTYLEEFEVIEGKATFTVNGKERILGEGESIIVHPNTPHTFRSTKEEGLTIIVEARPEGRLREVVPTIFALAHEGKAGKKGEPGFWQGIAMGADLQEDTLFTQAPIGLQKFLFKLLGPVANRKGYQSIYPEFLEEAYWRGKVEQLEQIDLSGSTR
jgi:quercetin dioxygenase-like cupin family protein